MNAHPGAAEAGRPAVILFDLGNVLFSDPWESLLLTPGAGLGDRLGLDRSAVLAAGRHCWRTFSVREADEAEYWSELSRQLGCDIPAQLVKELEEELLLANPAAGALLAAASADGVRPVGIASNNTSFWYAKQADRLRLDRWIDPGLVFLSSGLGVSKSTPGRGLLEIAAEHVRPSATLFVEDRGANLARARGLGFRTVEYAFKDESAGEARHDSGDESRHESSGMSGVSVAELLDTITG
ncbi:HAD family hydrolase [Streptomyces sp. NPDC127119]|uniref:HAD family hydrolase n=1 Tax=Streptomyces sp. NPDC127119 TaxID=3345370 RepID=UPI00362C84B9